MAKKMAVKVANKKQSNLQFVWPEKQRFKPLFYLLILGAVVSSIWLGLQVWSQAVPVQKIVVANKNGQVTAELIKRLISTQENSLGKSGLLAIDMDAVYRSVEQLPWVKTVSVRKVWPDTLHFDVEEKKQLLLINDKLLLEDGELVDIITPSQVSVSQKIQWHAAEQYESDDRLMVWKKIENIQSDLTVHKRSLSELTISDTGEWLAVVDSNLSVMLGRKHQQERIQRFSNSWTNIEKNELLKAVDLRYSNGFAVTYKNSMTQPEKQPG